jgi:glycosyltransferase involved in cell wall biosynthesis
MRICFTVERFLGHSSYFDRLRSYIDTRQEIDPEYLYMENLRFPLRIFSNAAVPLLKDFDLDLHSARWQIAYSYSAIRNLKRVLSKNHLDALYFHTQNVALLSARIAAEYPLIISTDATNHLLSEMGWDGSLPFTRATWKPGILLERRAFQKARRIIAWSGWVKDSLLHDYGIDERKIEVIPPFVPVPRKTIVRNGDALPRLLFVGRDFRRKGGEDLLECFKGGMEERCELHIVTSSNIPNGRNLFIHPKVSQSELESLYEAADIFVFPTKKDCSPQVVLEAMSFGLPVISTKVGALPEMIVHGRNGFLVNPGDCSGLRGYINYLLEDISLRRRMGNESRSIIDKEFSFPTNAKRVCDVLLGIAG